MPIFEALGLDIVVTEAGIGGRLDATNAMPDKAVVVSALTSVDLDHQAFLGNTVAGIARRGKPFVLGRQKFPEVEEVVRNAVLGPISEVISSGLPIPSSSLSKVKIPSTTLLCQRRSLLSPSRFEGDYPSMAHTSYQIWESLRQSSPNFSHTLRVHMSHLKFNGRITPETFTAGFSKATWPGRLSFHTLPNGKSILVDGAHNPGSAQTLADFIATLLPSLPTPNDSFNLTYVLGLSNSPPKQPLDTLAPLFSPSLLFPTQTNVKVNVGALEFSPPEDMPWVKAEPPSAIYDAVKAHCPHARLWSPSERRKGLSDALDWATGVSGDAGLTVLAGSLYLVSDFYRFQKSSCDPF